MPSLPLKYESAETELDLSGFSDGIQKTEDRRQQAYDLSRQLQKIIVTTRNHVGEKDSLKPLRDSVQQDKEDTALLHQNDQHARQPRLANLSNRIEDMVRLEAYQHFLETGRLVPLSTVSAIYACTDEEYLTGACMGLSQDLQRYGLGRATVRDT